MNSAALPKHTFVMLDALRGTAALSVVIYHFFLTLYKNRLAWPPSAFLAVDFFFLLSGFVIMHAYSQQLEAGMSARHFMIRRLIRLYPLYFLGTSITIFASCVGILFFHDPIKFSPLSYILSLLFLPTPPEYASSIGIFPYNGPSWSLSLEMAINFIFALIYLYMSPKRWRYLVMAGGVSLIAAYWFYNNSSMGWNWQEYWGGVARILYSFFAGVLLCNIYKLKQPSPISMRWGAILIVGLFTIFIMPDYGWCYAVIACFALFPIIVWFGARVTVTPPFTSVCKWSGRLSYVIYIIHRPLLDCYIAFGTKLGLDCYSHPRIRACAYVFSVLLIAALLDRFYDVPVRTYLAQKLRVQHAR